MLTDLGSKNRLVVDGVPFDRVEVKVGVTVCLGRTTLTVEDASTGDLAPFPIP